MRLCRESGALSVRKMLCMTKHNHRLINTPCEPDNETMGHIFTTKYIRDERELGEEAKKSSRNDLTCLKPAFTGKQGSCLYLPEKRLRETWSQPRQ